MIRQPRARHPCVVQRRLPYPDDLLAGYALAETHGCEGGGDFVEHQGAAQHGLEVSLADERGEFLAVLAWYSRTIITTRCPDRESSTLPRMVLGPGRVVR